MMDQSTKEDARALKRRVIRFQRHKLPRRSRLTIGQRLCVWLMILFLIALALLLL